MPAAARRRPAPLVVVLLAAALGLLGGMVWSVTHPSGHSAVATVFVSADGVQAVDDLQEGSRFAQQAGDSFAAVATQRIVLEAAAERLGGTSATELARHVAVRRQPDTAVLEIRGEDASASRAAAIANAVATELVDVAPSLQPAASSQGAPDLHLTQVERATATAASDVHGVVPVLLGLLAGAGIGALALLLTRFGRPPFGGLGAPALT